MVSKKLKITDRIKFDFDKIQETNSQWIVGIDEVGWGCIAGDLYLGAVAIHIDLLKNMDSLIKEYSVFETIRDSKKLSEDKRNNIFEVAKNINHPLIKIIYGKGTIDSINTKGLAPAFDDALFSIFNQLENFNISLHSVLFLMDGSRIPKPLTKFKTTLVIKGDDTSFAIGFASIMAKETRDNYMKELDNQFPQYNWKSNKGYGTADHTSAIKINGISKFHRIKSSEKIIS